MTFYTFEIFEIWDFWHLFRHSTFKTFDILDIWHFRHFLHLTLDIFHIWHLTFVFSGKWVDGMRPAKSASAISSNDDGASFEVVPHVLQRPQIQKGKNQKSNWTFVKNVHFLDGGLSSTHFEPHRNSEIQMQILHREKIHCQQTRRNISRKYSNNNSKYSD